jgi:aryl-alcohol dehydrogenase-like predicted oxidoreductase
VNVPVRAANEAATDWVTLGKADVKVTRLAFGTGTMSGKVQRELGQPEFTRLVRYAYDHGIRFFETAESYGGMHEMLGIALKGLPRDSYRLMSKVTTYHDTANPQDKFEDLLGQVKTDYFDIMLLHWQHTPDWPSESERWAEGIEKAQQKGMIRARGASVHGLPALRRVPDDSWLQVAMIRMNQAGKAMDAEAYNTTGPGNVPEVVDYVKKTKAKGMGVISMKLVGEGTFTERSQRQAAMRFAFRHAGVDAVTVGYKNTAEIDEAIENINLAFA